jgi:hypothetical protein
MYDYPFVSSIREEENVSVNIMMMNTNYDKQYKTEAFVCVKKKSYLLFFMGKK